MRRIIRYFMGMFIFIGGQLAMLFDLYSFGWFIGIVIAGIPISILLWSDSI